MQLFYAVVTPFYYSQAMTGLYKKVKKVTYTNLVDSIGYTIVYLCSNHTSY